MALRLESLTRRFGAQTALFGVSVHVRPGDCYGFLGHNGAGKTTAMRIALGLDRADAGRVIVDGFDAAEHPREARARMGGLIETPGFHGHMDGARNLVLLARLQGFDRSSARTEAARLLAAVGLTAAGGKAVRSYSQGMRQRLGIAQALMGSPKVVLLDEPMNGLDPEGIEEIRRLLARLTREEGMTVLLSSHQLSEIEGLCNRIGILRQGRMLVEEEMKTLLAAESGRYEVATADDAEAARLLDSAGIAAKPRTGGGLEAALGVRPPGKVARLLVSSGVELRAWAPRPPSLEEIYLRFAQGRETQGTTSPTGPAPVAAPTARLAPRWPVHRVFRYEIRRLTSTAAVPLLLLLPAAPAVWVVWSRHVYLLERQQEVAAGRLFSTDHVTAFLAVAESLQSALPLVALLLAGIASQSISGETSRGTLTNVLVRPVGRVQTVLGKATALLVVTVAAYAIVAGASLAASAHWFAFEDYADILPNGKRWVQKGGEASRMWAETWRCLATTLPSSLAFSGIGLFAGSLVRTGAAALGLALGGLAVWQASLMSGDIHHVEEWFPTVRYFALTTELRNDARPPRTGLDIVAPLVMALVAVALASFVLRRRSIR